MKLGPPLLTLMIFTSASAQVPEAAPQFEVVSIKRNISLEANGGSRVLPGGRFSAMNAPVTLLLVAAYRVPASRIVDGPAWVRTERYDVEARAEGAVDSQVPSMLRHMLGERFKLSAHRERREIQSYNLTFDRPDRRLGPRLTLSAANCDDSTTRARQLPTGSPACGFTSSVGRFAGGSVSFDVLANMLSTAIGRPVVNMTGDDRSYDVDFQWSSVDDPFSDSGPLVTAIREQLGLKLEPTRGLFDVLAIDAIELPTPD